MKRKRHAGEELRYHSGRLDLGMDVPAPNMRVTIFSIVTSYGVEQLNAYEKFCQHLQRRFSVVYPDY